MSSIASSFVTHFHTFVKNDGRPFTSFVARLVSPQPTYDDAGTTKPFAALPLRFA